MTDATRKDSSVTEVPETGPSGLWQARYIQVLLMFTGFSLAYAMRVCMSIALVAMKNDEEYYEAYDNMDEILSSFFWGYTVTQIPAGQLTKYSGAKNILVIGIGLCAVLHSLTPLAARAKWTYVLICRIGMGLFQGCVLPCMHTLLASWAPPSERARLVTITYSGPYAGTVISNALSGVLAESTARWPSIFYVFGEITILWAIIFFFFGADSPSKNHWISEEEKRYIESSLGNTEDKKLENTSNKTPWKEILSSPPVWALVAAHCGQNWGFWVIITEISIYMSDILGFNLSKNGFMAALPYLTVMVLAFPASWISDYAMKKGVRKVVLRKVANTISQWGPALALVGMCFTGGEGTTLSVFIFIVAVGSNATVMCGFQSNHLDLSPNNAGVLMSISNCFASIAAIIAPLVVGQIVTDTSNFSQWQILFYLSAGIYFVCNLIFLLFGSTERQWWDDPKAVETNKKHGQIEKANPTTI